MNLQNYSLWVNPPNRWMRPLLFTLSFMCFSLLGYTQSTLTGTVVDAGGLAIIGANISVPNTDVGTVSDVDGTFNLAIPAGSDEIQVSFLGYQTQRVSVNNMSNISIIMIEDTEVLDEVIVVGYGTQKKSDLVGSVASINGSDLKALVVGNPTSALQGKMAGIQIENNGGAPGGDANVFVRGVSSLTNSFPLYVIDGTFADNMNFLNPKDIESIEVLKDASSAAIYGSRAANGVVIITTKRGSDDGQTKVSLDIRGGVESPTKMLDLLNGQEFIQYRNQVEANDGTGFVLPSNLPSTDWQDLSLNSGTIQDYGLSVSGGNERAKFYVSGNYYDQEGILVGSGFQRLNARANSQFKLGKLTINQSLSLVQSDLQENNWFGFDGATAPILAENVPGNDGGFEAPEFSVHNFGGLNKFGLASLEDNNLNSKSVLGNINFAYQLTPELSVKLNYGMDYLNQYSRVFTPTYFMSNSDAVINVNDQNDLAEVRGETMLTVWEPTLSYNKDLSNNSNLNVVVGYTEQKIDFSNLGIYVQGLPSNNIQVVGAAAPSNVQNIGGVNNVSGLRSLFGRVNYNHNDKYLVQFTMRRDATSKFAPDFRVGYFPSVSFGWKVHNEPFFAQDGLVNRLKLRAGFGTLGSQNIPDYSYQSVFDLTSNTSFGNALQTGYAQTAFALEDLKWEEARTFNIGADLGLMDDRLTMSVEYYNKDVSDVLVGVNLPSTAGTSLPVVRNAGAINNSGIEFEALYRSSISSDFKYQLGFNLGTFNSEITELPNPIIGPSTSEDLTRVNRFIEGEAPGVYWGFVVDGVYADQAAIESDQNIANDGVRKSLVQPGDFIRRDLNGDGVIDAGDQTILGDPTPDFIYGINFTGSYKKLDFGLFFNGVQGNEIYNLNKFFNIFWADDNKLTDVLNAWTPQNTNTEIPRSTTLDQAENRAPSSFFVEDGSYLRLRTLELGYTMDNAVLNSTFSNLRFFITGQNLLTLTGYSGYDPDVSSTNGGRANRDSGFYGNRVDVNPLLGRGLDARAYPNARAFVFGVQATF